VTIVAHLPRRHRSASRIRPSAAIVIAGWLAALLLTGSCLALGGCSHEPPAAPPEVVKVVAAKPVVKQIVEWDEYVGRLEAVETVAVRARVSGYLKSIHFDEGELVKENQLLFVIDPRPFQAELSQAKADLNEALAGVKQATAAVVQSEAQRREAVARQDLAGIRAERTRGLAARNVVTADELDARESELLQANADVEANTAEIDAAQAAIATAKAKVETARAAVELAVLNLSYTELRSPIAGRVSSRYVTVGNLISGGTAESTLLTTVVSLDPIHCVFDADEQAFLKYMRLAQEGRRQSSRDVKNPVYIALADEPDGYPHHGHMDFVDNRLDPNTGTMRGRAIFPNPDNSFTPGLFARLRLPGSATYQAVLIPDAAVGSDQAEKFVLVVGKDNKVRRLPVELGSRSHGLRIVRKGLKGDERIIVRGIQRVRPGIAVTAELETLKAAANGGLPDDYEPVPEERWLRVPRAAFEEEGPPATETDLDSAPPLIDAAPVSNAPSEPEGGA
jgi:RND family efflux transporter MFP subunit